VLKRLAEFWLQCNRKSEWATCEEEQEAHQRFLEEYLMVLKSILPSILEAFSKIPDPRDPKKIKHKLTVVLFYSIVIFALGFDSRRDANRRGTSPTILEIFRSVFPEIDSCPHMDTVARLLESLSFNEIEKIHINEVKRLIRNKKFRRLMADGCYVVAIDGTQKWSGNWKFDPRLLTRTHRNGDTTYHVYVLEASLVGPQGIFIPLMSEFCENDPDMGEQTKQDCELKAFYRLAGRLKLLFPRQRLMIVADGLYPKGPVMELCRTNGWDFMIVLPDEVCLSGVWTKAKAIRDGHTRDAQPGQKLRNQWGDRSQEFWWANRIVYTWKDRDGTLHHTLLHVVVCHETWQEKANKESPDVLVAKERTWAWVSAKPLTANNVLERCNCGGRARWNIEEGILTEKKRGYHYEHMFSYDWNGMKCWHALMHLGHLINILVIHSKALWGVAKRKGIKGLWDLLKDCVRGNWADTSRLAKLPVNPKLRLVI
jgi:hypothetical protein